MKYFVTSAITVLTMFLLTGVTIANGDDAQPGKAVFETKCKMCHGADGKGNPIIAKAMKVTLPDMTSPAIQSKSDEALKKQITEGGGKMKPISGLTDQQITDVIAFIRSLGKS
jgi:cytochrome c6